MIPIKEAEKHAEDMFCAVPAVLNGTWKKEMRISDTDSGDTYGHVGKRELILLLALIYEVEPKTITINKKQGYQ